MLFFFRKSKNLSFSRPPPFNFQNFNPSFFMQNVQNQSILLFQSYSYSLCVEVLIFVWWCISYFLGIGENQYICLIFQTSIIRGHLNCKNRWGSAFWWKRGGGWYFEKKTNFTITIRYEIPTFSSVGPFFKEGGEGI